MAKEQRAYGEVVHGAGRSAGAVRQLQDAQEEGRRLDSLLQRPFIGLPTKVVTARFWASWGDVVLCDPTAAAFTVILPRPDRTKIGAVVGIKNHSASTNTITVACSTAEETVDGAATVTITTARQMVVYLYVGDDEWIVAGTG
jgi:hypothetical protein